MTKLYIKIGIIFLLLLFPLALVVSQDTTSKPEAPTNLRLIEINAETYSFTMEWDPVPGATEYRIYQGHSNRLNFGWTRWRTNTPDPVTTPAAEVRRVTLNTNYVYRVTAVNANGEGAPSDHIEVNIVKK